MQVRQWIRTALTVFVIGLGNTAWAHGDLTPAHGGKMVESHGQVLELTVRGKVVDIYFTNHEGHPEPTDGATGKVVFLLQGKKLETVLKPSGDNRLSGEAAAEVTSFDSAVITVKRDGNSLSARISARH
ncbi:MAG: hypothetical protein HQM04_09540 [Magnetococcales bacterium]|nr:hypothetical protein [Magnetococcales bacterium]MBF0115274.1 hypothetical protein [Magnetococcales bacterium]